MKPSLLNKLICPQCATPLLISASQENAAEIRKGLLNCLKAGHIYKIENGIPGLVFGLDEESQKEQDVCEKDSQVRVARPELSREWLLGLPGTYVQQLTSSAEAYNNGDIECIFNQMISTFPLPQGQHLLDIGANVCWSTRVFAKIGYEATALDFVTAPLRGLESADVYMQADGIFFERVQANMEKLPFKNESYDLIFSISTIHHSGNLEKLFLEMHRILKTGGKAIIADSTIGWLIRNSQEKHIEEMHHHGLNDHAYRYRDFMQAIKKAGFKIQLLFPQSTIRKYSLLRVFPDFLRLWLLPALHVVRGLGFVAILTKETR